MSSRVCDFYEFMKIQFPLELSESYDNCGLLAGDPQQNVSSVLVSLDITGAVIDEAADKNAGLIVSHHPLFFGKGIKSIASDTCEGNCAEKLIRGGIAAICMHTNADAADGGVNNLLAEAAGISEAKNLGGGESGLIGRVGVLQKQTNFSDYAAFVKKALQANGLRILRCSDSVKTVAVGGGSCGDMLDLAKSAGADTFITADVKYHTFRRAEFLGINLIDAGHFATENLICRRFKELLSRHFPAVKVLISEKNRDIIEYL